MVFQIKKRSCWAFAAADAIQAAFAVKKGRKNVLVSRQQLVDCVANNTELLGWNNQPVCRKGGCGGCEEEYALAYAIKFGLTTERAYPYTSARNNRSVCLHSFFILLVVVVCFSRSSI